MSLTLKLVWQQQRMLIGAARFWAMRRPGPCGWTLPVAAVVLRALMETAAATSS